MAMHAKVVDIIITIIIIMIIIHVKVVDVFLVQESNFTNSGEGRPLEMLKKLEGGWLEEHVEKLVYLLRLLVVTRAPRQVGLFSQDGNTCRRV